MNIKAIETEYKGYRFRSRLEARWAVFFDSTGIEWEYETEGYRLTSGKHYLPDFYFSKFGYFIEIKPKTGDTVQLEKVLREFSESMPIVAFFGLPSLGWNGTLYCGDVSDTGSGGAYETKIGFAYCHKCNCFTVSLSDHDYKFINGRRTLFASAAIQEKLNTGCDPGHRWFHTVGELEGPINAARSARFEHGEKGGPSR